MGKSYANYDSNRSRSWHEDKSRSNCREQDRRDTHATRSRLHHEILCNPDLTDGTVPQRKRNDRAGGWRANAYHEPSRRPPKLKAIYNQSGHDVNSLTVAEVKLVLSDASRSARVSDSCPISIPCHRDADRIHQILSKQVERRGQVAPFKTRPKEKREFFSE